MKPLDYILIAAVVLGLVTAIVCMVRAKKRGRGCCSSGNCCGNCATCGTSCAGKRKDNDK